MKESKLWYKNAIIYAIDIDFFFDADGDGRGDFRGALAKLDYLQDLGITCIWLLPFYPSPNYDNGYDVTNHLDVDPQIGSFDDIRAFVDEAEKRGIRVLIDLIIHHTSDKHPWFEASRNRRPSKYTNYYVWTDKPPEDPSRRTAFPGPENGVWSYDETAGAYYHHLFYHRQPDLNLANEDVRQEVLAIMDFWLSFGVAGFRIDAAHDLFQSKGVPGTEIENPGEFLEAMSAFLKDRNKEAIMMGETDVAPDGYDLFYGNGNRMELLLNFLVNNYLFLSLTRHDARPLQGWLERMPVLPREVQWVNFIRNLDELNIERLTEAERQEVFEQFAPEDGMRVYGRGIRRRIASMLKEDERWLQMVHNLLFSLPGTPILVYGDEIGMGDDLSLEERESVRTPMQWSDEKHGGFSTGDTAFRAVISEGRFGYQEVNVEKQQQEPDSLLNNIKRFIKARKEHFEIGYGACQVLEVEPSSVLALRYEYEGRTLVTLHNFSDRPVHYKIKDIRRDKFEPVLEGPRPLEKMEETEGDALKPYGFKWLEKAAS